MQLVCNAYLNVVWKFFSRPVSIIVSFLLLFREIKAGQGWGLRKGICCFTVRQWRKWQSVCFKPDSSWKIMSLSITTLAKNIWTLSPFIRTKCTARVPQVPLHLLHVPLSRKWSIWMTTGFANQIQKNAPKYLRTLFSKRESQFSKWKLSNLISTAK